MSIDSIKILLLGATGSGKSTFVERWMNIKGFSSSCIYSHTEFPMIFEKKNTETLIDTPGLFDCSEKKERRSQQMLNNLSNQLRATENLNLVIIFHKYTSRLDSNFHKMIEQYQTLINPRNKLFLICFTGMIPKNEKGELDRVDWEEHYNCVIGHTYLCINEDYNIDEFPGVMLEIRELIRKVEPHNSYLVDKVILAETMISKLMFEKEHYKKNSEENKEQLKKIEEEIKNCKKVKIVSNKNRCPGITGQGYRCSGTRYCHWYLNYKKGYSNAHHTIEEFYDEFVAINLEKLKVKNETKQYRLSPKKPEKPSLYENETIIKYPGNEPFPEFSENGVGIFRVIVNI